MPSASWYWTAGEPLIDTEDACTGALSLRVDPCATRDTYSHLNIPME